MSVLNFEGELTKRQCLKRQLYTDDMACRAVPRPDDSSGMTNQIYLCDGGWVW